MPAEDCLRPDQQSRPGRLWEVFSQGGHDHAVARSPADALDLALQNLNLAAEGQHLNLRLCLVLTAGGI